MFILVLILLMVVTFALGICALSIHLLRQSNARLKTFSTSLQDVVTWDGVQKNDLKEQLAAVTWERDAAHMMIETLLRMVPEDYQPNAGQKKELVKRPTKD